MADADTLSEVLQGPTRAGRDRGFSIVEVVVTLTLMAVVLVPIMNAVVVSIRASSQGRSAAQVETALVNAADRVNRAPMLCTYQSYAEAGVPPHEGFGVSVTYAYYVPTAAPPDQWVNQPCPDGMDDATDDLVQLVEITITSPDGKIQRKIEVVKSRV